MSSIAERIIAFNESLSFDAPLPDGIGVMNPFRENPDALPASSEFYRKYYNDENTRRIILGINPGRFGAGLTGVPFTDPKRLRDVCGINAYKGPDAHEPSSVFVYDMIRKYGGAQAFYARFYINSICPLGFTKTNPRGKEVNYNYYDSAELAKAARPFMIKCVRAQLEFNIATDVCFCLGTGKNADCLRAINDKFKFFKQIIALEHPRYVIQYKSKQMPEYIDKYLRLLKNAPPKG